MRRTLLAVLIAAACKREGRPPSLGEAISVEQPGGSASQLFSQGSEIPTSATESFTTAKDNEKRLFVHVLRGAGRTAANLKSEAWWEIDDVSATRAAEPRVMVTFEVDGQGHLSLSAREEDRRLPVRQLENTPAGKAAPSPLAEPDDDEDLEEDAPE
ncbi:MAG: hypothetical protein E6J65_14290 [Deltaproteobacteria bacterium]|nr:MAG: hypothetical protein E6J65_14290 [Deltaproteobacteria bacterium]